jgi:hypothetical protein
MLRLDRTGRDTLAVGPAVRDCLRSEFEQIPSGGAAMLALEMGFVWADEIPPIVDGPGLARRPLR